MGLKKIRSIRQFTDFDVDGKIVKKYEVTFTTEKTEGEFTLEIPAEEYTAKLAKDLATARATEIDQAVT